MNNRPTYNNRLNAFTLIELLVVMIITSVLLLAVFDGLSLFRRYCGIISKRVSSSIKLNENYFMLENIIEHSDSIVEIADGEVVTFRKGDEYATISIRDSLLLVNFANDIDTVFSNIKKLSFIKHSEQEILIDSVNISLSRSDTEKPQTISLSVHQTISETLNDVVDNIEKGYGY